MNTKLHITMYFQNPENFPLLSMCPLSWPDHTPFLWGVTLNILEFVLNMRVYLYICTILNGRSIEWDCHKGLHIKFYFLVVDLLSPSQSSLGRVLITKA